ncbi:TPA: phosphate propanoyltransferase, partial [Escherichia coli]|nr:phosphate propanoyltransferase [Escherichia coli]
IDVQTNGPRGGVLSHVVVRVTADAVLELHIDMEEANGVGLRNGDTVRGIKQAARHG